MTIHGLFLRIAIVGVLLGLTPGAVLADSSKVSTELTNTGIDGDATGKVKLKLKDGKSRLDIKLKSLDAATTYTLFVDGLPWTSFLPPKGKAKLRFSSPVKKDSDMPLPFDPRGAPIAVSDGVNDVLTGVLSGTGESPLSKVKEISTLTPTPLAGDGKAVTKFKQNKSKAELKAILRSEQKAAMLYQFLNNDVLC